MTPTSAKMKWNDLIQGFSDLSRSAQKKRKATATGQQHEMQPRRGSTCVASSAAAHRKKLVGSVICSCAEEAVGGTRKGIDTRIDRYIDIFIRNVNEKCTKSARSIDIFGFEWVRYRPENVDPYPCGGKQHQQVRRGSSRGSAAAAGAQR